MARVILLAVVLTGVLACGGAGPDDASPRKAWLQAPNSQGPKWNRTTLLKQMVASLDMVGTPRTKVLEMFGPPGYTAELYPGGARMDFYRLSAANDGSLRFDYESGSTVTRYSIESSGCRCESCNPAAPAVTAAALNQSGLIRDGAPEKTLTMSQFEKLVGRAGDLSRSPQTVGGQVWLNYTETWRVDPAPHRFLIVDGHVPLRSAPTQEVGDKPVLSWALISFQPGCLAQ